MSTRRTPFELLLALAITAALPTLLWATLYVWLAHGYAWSVAVEVLALCLLLVVLRRGGRPVSTAFAVRPIHRRGAAIAAAVPLAYLVPITVWAFLNAPPLGTLAPGAELLIWRTELAWLPALYLLLIAPVCEELLFRGFIFRVLSQSLPGPVLAALISSLGFALAHAHNGGAAQLLVFVEALVLCYVVRRSGSVLYGMLAHFINNAYAALAMLLMAAAY